MSKEKTFKSDFTISLGRSKKRYRIKLYDYAIIDNHIPVIVKIDTVTDKLRHASRVPGWDIELFRRSNSPWPR